MGNYDKTQRVFDKSRCVLWVLDGFLLSYGRKFQGFTLP
jgi:hypothetical protein